MYDADWFNTLDTKKVYDVGFHKDHDTDVATSRETQHNHIPFSSRVKSLW